MKEQIEALISENKLEKQEFINQILDILTEKVGYYYIKQYAPTRIIYVKDIAPLLYDFIIDEEREKWLKESNLELEDLENYKSLEKEDLFYLILNYEHYMGYYNIQYALVEYDSQQLHKYRVKMIDEDGSEYLIEAVENEEDTRYLEIISIIKIN